MNSLLITSIGIVVLVFVTRFVVGKQRARELDRDYSIELSCGRDRAVRAAATAGRGVLWEVGFTDNGLLTRHLKSRNVIHVDISDLPGRPGHCCAKVWTRYNWAEALFILRPDSYTDTRRKRDRIVRALSAYEDTRPARTTTH